MKRNLWMLVVLAGCSGDLTSRTGAVIADEAVQQRGVAAYRIGDHVVDLLSDASATIGTIRLARAADVVTISYSMKGFSGELELTRPGADGRFEVPAGEGNVATAMQADPGLAAFFAQEKVAFAPVSALPLRPGFDAPAPNGYAYCGDLPCNYPACHEISYDCGTCPGCGQNGEDYSWLNRYCSCNRVQCPDPSQRDLTYRSKTCWEPGTCYQATWYQGCTTA